MTGDRGPRVGVDVGGTFTDLVAIEDGAIAVTKRPSTPDAPDEAVAATLRAASIDPVAIRQLAHGTTVATNAVLEGEWAETALITTAGFRDVLAIGRQTRPAIYDLQATQPDPIVPRHRRFEVRERLDERGDVLEPLADDAVEGLVDSLEDAEAIAVVLLFAYENDDHERAVASQLRAAGIDCPIARSSAVLPEMREYERSVATALNAALVPRVSSYLKRLDERVTALGCEAGLRVMHSGGGLITADAATDRPVRTLLSGPAAGVLGATHVGALAGFDDLLTFDMGGTSCDVSLVRGGEPAIATDSTVGPYPIAVPMVDVHTVGAGGGSIGWLDEGSALRVGPQSAGADPGPICYGRGGTAPTTTDAQYLLGRIDPADFAASSVGVDRRAVADGFDSIADALETDSIGAARGLLEVATAELERAIRVVSVERGHDPRSSTLVAYGGAGPVHGPQLARHLDIPRVLIPPAAGVLSAVGLLASDLVYDFGETSVRPLEEIDTDWLEAAFEEFEATGRDRLAAEGLDESVMTFDRAVELRYRGQSFSLRVPVAVPTDLATIATAFHERHRDRYGHAAPDDPIELVAVRVRARGETETPRFQTPATRGDPADAVVDERRASFDSAWTDTPVYERASLPAGSSLEGPAIIDGTDHTTVIHPKQVATVDQHGSLVVTEGSDA